jgi:glycerol-3-phosphate O-acyltransferase / dihydroxyacetone phosphate acyltransferase
VEPRRTRIHSPVVRALARVACRVFYRVDCVGAPPASGPLLLLPNHANALLDPAVIWATSGRDVRFLAKSTLFDGPLRWLLRGAGAIPVYRKLDQGVDVTKNTETFADVDAALSAGDAVCIFPEGVSHSTGRLVPLRTGAARMALSAARTGTRVALVPVGLNFERKTTFRSRVTVVYGPPFWCDDLVSGEQEAAPATVRALTDRITTHLRQLLIEADPKGEAALVERVDRLYAAARGRGDAADRVPRRRAIAAGIGRLRTKDPQRYEEVLLRFRRYDQRLRRFGFRDRHLDWNVSAAEASQFAVRETLIAIVLVPLALTAMVAFVAPYRLTGHAARWFTREPDVAATAKVVGGFLIYAAWLALLAAIAWWLSGVTAAVVLLAALPALAVAGLFAIERESAVLDAVRAWFLLRRTGADTRKRLRHRRSELADVLDEVNAWLIAESGEKVETLTSRNGGTGQPDSRNSEL